MKISKSSANRFVEITQAVYRDGVRRYYVTDAEDKALVLIVCRGGLDLPSLVGFTVDANIGWEDGTPGFVLGGDEGRRHTKITIYRQLLTKAYDRTLGAVMHQAPSR